MKWEKLGEIAEIKNGYAFKSAKYQDSGIRIIRITNVQKGYIEDSSPKFYNERDMERLENFYLFERDILISLTGNVGRVARVTKEILPAALNQRVASIKPNEDINNDYLFYMMNSDKFENICILESNGVAQKNLGTTALSKIRIPVPTIKIQKQIVEVLDEAKNLVDKRKKQISLLDNLIESIFYDMFGDPVINDKGWNLSKLESISRIVRGASPRPINEYLGGTIPWIKIGDGSKGDDIYLHDTQEKIIEEGVSKSRFVEKGSLIFANCGVSLGFSRIITFDGCIHDGWLALQEIDEKVNKIFLLKVLNSYTEYFRATAPDGTQPNLNTTIMKRFEVPIPPLLLQNQFVEKIETIKRQKQLLENSLTLLEDNYNSLTQRAFKGELFN